MLKPGWQNIDRMISNGIVKAFSLLLLSLLLKFCMHGFHIIKRD